VERYLAAILVFGIAGNELLHAILDGMNPAAGIEGVTAVISMSATTEPDSWRALHSPVAATIIYAAIWLAHAISGVVGMVGTVLLLKSATNPEVNADRAMEVAILGVGVGAVLYLVGFVTLASGWFIIHTSPTPPNFLPNAERLFLCYMAVIVYLTLRRR
jgi:predicted small integral membrane protein